jgi:hypothetical protein
MVVGILGNLAAVMIAEPACWVRTRDFHPPCVWPERSSLVQAGATAHEAIAASTQKDLQERLLSCINLLRAIAWSLAAKELFHLPLRGGMVESPGDGERAGDDRGQPSNGLPQDRDTNSETWSDSERLRCGLLRRDGLVRFAGYQAWQGWLFRTLTE